jgi:2-hydroxycyclohexanecarboxyl-CoA dehydrogenase
VDLGLKGKVAIVTGAGRGIGRAIALTLAEEGAKVAVNDIFGDRADGVVSEIRARGGEAIAVLADVTDESQVRAMVAQVIEAWATVHILVNNAGIPAGAAQEMGGGFGGPYFAQQNRAAWDRVMHIITYGVLNCTSAVLQTMQNQSWGRIINIISDAGRVGELRLATYSMAKAGAAGFARALAKEVGRYRITVNCVSPGTTETEATAALFEAARESEEGRARLDAIGRQYPLYRGLGRLGRPQDIADAVAFLVSERAEWITGQTLSVNGGYAMF